MMLREVKLLEKISVRNYRTFPSETTFEIAPITILLGINSSGKSSITRLLPLFAQSLTNRSAGPILWVTDNLDYGSFLDNVHNNNASGQIEFKLEGRGATIFQNILSRSMDLYGQSLSGEFKYSICVGQGSDVTSISSLDIEFYGERVQFIARTPGGLFSSIKLNGEDYSGILKGRDGVIGRGFFPEMFFVRFKDGAATIAPTAELLDQAVSLLGKYAHANASKSKLRGLITPVPFLSLSATIQLISNRAAAIPSLKRNLEKISKREWREIWLTLFICNYSSIIESIKEAVEPDITQGGYLGPVRARASRYYRRQELAVDQIDSTGDNLAMYLNSLSVFELNQINTDLAEFFGHKIIVDPGQGHISLRIGAKDAEHTDNLADVGFGFTQLLPVIAQVHAVRRWALSTSRRTRTRATKSPIFAVEQPELHLHPAYQAKLGAYLVHAARNEAGSIEPQLRFLIETHSEQLVNAIASAVAAGEIAAEDVKIYLFERTPDSDGTEVISADIRPNGEIPNWPYGFFTSGRLHPPVSLG